MEKKAAILRRQLLKFCAVSVVGIVSFAVPVSFQGEPTTVVGILTSLVGELLSFCMDELILALVAFSAIGSLYDNIMTKLGKPPAGRLHSYFKTSIVYLVTKMLALVFTWMCYFSIGPAAIIAPSVGGSMIGLGKTLVALSIALSYLLPFLTDGGLMEFFGEITRPFVRPLFKVPSDASLDLIASWMGASNAAVILSAEKYHRGYYTKREAAIVMCDFSLVSIPFCLVVAETAGVAQYFPAMYGLLCLLGILLAVVLPRIYPLNRLEDTYYAKLPSSFVSEPGEGILRRAVRSGCAAAESFKLKNVWESGSSVMFTILFNLMPTVIGWGILGMLVVKHTPVFQWLSIPMGWFMDVLGVEGAYTVAPATLVGFVDMFIPALLVTGTAAVRTRLIIATLSLIQIIYITEVGAVVIQTKLGVDVKKLFLIFLERTILALPLIILASHMIIP